MLSVFVYGVFDKSRSFDVVTDKFQFVCVVFVSSTQQYLCIVTISNSVLCV